MKCKHFPGMFSLVLALFVLIATGMDAQAAAGMIVQLGRNATVRVTYGETTFLVDPMLAQPGAYPGFADTYRSELRNPLTPLPMPVKDILGGVDAVILTHTHLDHWDEAAQKALPQDIPLFVQDEKDEALLRSQGFRDVRILAGTTDFGGVTLSRTACRHGSETMFADPVVGPSLGSVMGIVFRAPGEKTVYLAADTVWFRGVEDAIATHRPDVIILNTGAAALTGEKFRDNPYIIMGREDTLRACKAAPKARIVAVHMDAINHMTVDRKDMSEYAYEQGIRDRVLVPFDGEVLHF